MAAEVGGLDRGGLRHAAVGLILVAAAALRIWELDHHLPFLPVPGEAKSLRVTLTMLYAGDPNPGFFHYPSLPFYGWATSLWAWAELWITADVFTKLSDLGTVKRVALGAARVDQPGIVLVLRAWSVGLGLGAVWLTLRTGRVLFEREGVALAAAALLALSPLHVVASHVGRHDIWLVFFVALSLHGAARSWRWGRPRDSLLAGVAGGLAVSCKYNGWVVLVALVVAHGLRAGPRGLRDRWLWGSVAAAGLAFLATSPFVLLDPLTFQADFLYELAHYSSDHAGRDEGGAGFYVATLLRQETVACLLAVGGVGVALATRRPTLVFASAFPVAYLVFLLPFQVRVERLLLPLLPSLCLLAGWSFDALLQQARGVRGPWGPLASGVLGLGLLIPGSAAHLAVQDLAAQDARDTSREWIAQHLPRGSKIALESYGPYVDPRVHQVVQVDAGRGFSALWVHRPGWYRERGFDYLVVSSGMSGRYLAGGGAGVATTRYRALFDAYPLLREFQLGGRSVWIYQVE